jgi:hypothetical protein
MISADINANPAGVVGSTASMSDKALTQLHKLQVKIQCCEYGIRCLFYPWIRDPGWVKSQDPDPGMNKPDPISESLETIFGLKYYLNSLMRYLDPDGKNSDPETGVEKIRIRDKRP